MSIIPQLVLPVFCLLASTFGTISAQSSICPPAENIVPCVCTIMLDKVRMRCEGSEVTEDTIRDVMQELREVNGVSGPNDWLDVLHVYMSETNMTRLDLTPFIRTRFEFLVASRNPMLSSIVGPPLPENEGLIDAEIVVVERSPLTDDDFKDVLKYFSTSRLASVQLPYNLLNGSSIQLIGDGSGDLEFLPGLAALPNLRSLFLDSNQISRLVSGQFKRHSRLILLSLELNKLEEIEEDAFLFDESPSNMTNELLTISMYKCNLTLDKIHPNSGINGIKRPVLWELTDNKLTTLPQEMFQPFLDVHPKSQIDVDGNPILCDRRVKWLKDRRSEYQPKVLYAFCVNDPLKTVFTSSLVDQ